MAQRIVHAAPARPRRRVESGSADVVGRFDRLLADLSARFVNLPPGEVDGAITDALRRIAHEMGADRAQLVYFSNDGHAHLKYSGALDGVPAAFPRSISSEFPWAVARLRSGHRVVMRTLGDLPPEAHVDAATWRRAGVRSNLTLPLRVAGRVEGALAFACLRHQRDWPADLVERVDVLADVLANAVAHKRTREALDAAIGFEQSVSATLRALLTAPRTEHDRIIEEGLRQVACVFGVERATFWKRGGDSGEFIETHGWSAEGVPRLGQIPPALLWINAALAGGDIVRFERLSDLPSAASADLPGLQARNIGAALIVPLVVSNAVVGALSLVSASENRTWPDALIPRVRLLGEVFAIVVARLAAERREQEAQAQATHAARVGTMGVLAASLIHELTQPLAASLANAETAAELLAAASPDLDELRSAVKDIVSDDRRVGQLVAQLRRFLRRGETQKSELDMLEVINEVRHLVRKDASEKSIEIALDAPRLLPTLNGDRVQLQQVLLNLLLNAFDAVSAREPDQRRVSILAHPVDGGVSVEVSDSGHGMDEPTIARIFQPFFTTKPGGMGLGLAISRSIVAAHGGTLSVRSVPAGGTTFRLELPTRAPGAATDASQVVDAAEGVGTVFVIDDHASMRRALERQLRSAGYEVESFNSADAYLERRLDVDVACIVSDVRMPGTSGLDLQASLAQDGRDIPIVFISGHGDVSTTAQALKAGAVNFLAKPFSRNELCSAVAEALARSRAMATERKASAELRSRYESLTPREREVLALVAEGRLNKVIADRLGAAEATIKIHRGRVMEKMGAASIADLVRMAESLAQSGAAVSGRKARGSPKDVP